MKNISLGIDTSCYTTSMAAVDDSGKLLADCRRMLEVAQGERGMPQSEIFFRHVLALPQLMEQLFSLLPGGRESISSVTVSTKPRPKEGSYMPAFRAGENMASIIAQSLGLPLLATSHQEGHIASAAWSAGAEGRLGEQFLALHISGGTTEILRVSQKPCGYAIDILAEADLAAGQFIDRIGVELGLPFPAGGHLEKLANSSSLRELTIKSTYRDGKIFFSGPYTAASRLIQSGEDGAQIAHAVFRSIAKGLLKALRDQIERTGLEQVLLAGGVMSNSLIRDFLFHKLHRAEFFLPHPRFCGDNAVGVALLGRQHGLE